MSVPSYTLTTADVVSVEEALGFFGERLGATTRRHGPESVSSDSLRITVWIDPDHEAPDLAEYLGVEDMLLVILDPYMRLSPERESAALADFLAATADFLEAHPGVRAVVEEDTSGRVILRRLEDGRIELDNYLMEPADFNADGAFNELGDRYSVKDLGGELDL